ncbi:MAG: ATP synthase F0 subunit C [Oscillospiraceae bacterium]|nr:ATP synthase F0 subunit C [Oscillospiraceae bacterium]
MSTIGLIAIGAGLYGLVGAGVAIGMGMATSHAMDAIARQPEASGKVNSSLMIGFVMMETVAIYGLLVSILLIFVLGGRA